MAELPPLSGPREVAPADPEPVALLPPAVFHLVAAVALWGVVVALAGLALDWWEGPSAVALMAALIALPLSAYVLAVGLAAGRR